MSLDGPHVRTELGAYVLGALEPAERRAVEQHLNGCDRCRDELVEISVLPSLLDRLSPEEATSGYDRVRRHLAGSARRSGAEVDRRVRRQLVVWRAATAVAGAAALVLGLLVWEPWDAPPDRLMVRIVPVSESAAAVEGTVAAYAWEWGTTVEIRVEDLPPASSYLVWAVSEDGERQRAGTWGPTEHRAALVRGASAIQRDDLVRVEVTDADGAPLFAASFDESGGENG